MRIENGNNITVRQGSAAIKAEVANHVIINENNINLLNVNGFHPIVQGIHLEGGHNAGIYCNDITMNPPAGVSHFAINVDNSPNAVFNANSITGGTQGLAFRGICNSPEQITGNQFNGQQISLMYNDLPPTFVGKQTNTGNLWGLATNANGVAYFSPVPSVDNQWKVIDAVDPFTGLNFSPPFCQFIPTPDWFRCDGVGSQISCAAPPPFQSPNADHLDAKIATNGFGDLDENAQWLLKKGLQDKLLSYPALLNESTFAAFKTNNENTSLGQLAAAQKALPAVFMLSASLQNQMDFLNAEIETAGASLRVLADQFEADPNNASLSTALDQKRAEIEDLTLDFVDLENLAAAERATNATNLAAIITAIDASHPYETALQTILDVWLHTIPSAQWPNAAQKATIESLAGSCFETNGPAVHYARVLETEFYNLTRNAEDCNPTPFSPEVLDRSKAPSGNEMAVFPNPVQDRLQINFDRDLSESTVQLFNAQGQQAVQKQFSGKSTDLSVEHLPSGLYFVRATSVEQTVRVIISTNSSSSSFTCQQAPTSACWLFVLFSHENDTLQHIFSTFFSFRSMARCHLEDGSKG